LRKEAGFCERLVWSKVRRQQIEGVEFRRQYGIGRYVVDFYCPKYGIVVEIDGITHEDEQVYANDQERERYLISLGLTVVRFNGKEVLGDINDVVERIGIEIRKRKQKQDLP